MLIMKLSPNITSNPYSSSENWHVLADSMAYGISSIAIIPKYRLINNHPAQRTDNRIPLHAKIRGILDDSIRDTTPGMKTSQDTRILRSWKAYTLIRMILVILPILIRFMEIQRKIPRNSTSPERLEIYRECKLNVQIQL